MNIKNFCLTPSFLFLLLFFSHAEEKPESTNNPIPENKAIESNSEKEKITEKSQKSTDETTQDTQDELAPWNLPPTLTDKFGLEFVLVQPGQFSYEFKDETIEYPFYLQKTELSQEAWLLITGSEEWKSSQQFRDKPAKVSPSHPVVYVNFIDIQTFINVLNSKHGKPDYRLPTQEEIAYATSAGTRTKYMTGDDYSGLSPYCWYNNNSDDLKMVGIKESNPWGIHDLNGNAWEWTMERGDDFTKNFPLLEDGEPNLRFKHGGSYMSDPVECSSHYQQPIPITMRDEDLGFRLVRRVVEDEF